MRHCLALLLTLLITNGSAAASGDAKPFEAQLPTADALRALDDATARADAAGKLLLVVLGANWCHDSVEFARRMQDDAFATLLEDRYEPLLVNVGDLDAVRPLITRYGEAVIYGTPTVLVVEPGSGEVLNRDSVWRWRDTTLISEQDTLAAFEAFKAGQRLPPAPSLSPEHAEALEAIRAFELAQAERIYEAYAVLGQALKEANGKPDAAFNRDWKNLAAMRAAITGDLVALRAEAAAQAAAGDVSIRLEYPSYSLFTDADL